VQCGEIPNFKVLNRIEGKLLEQTIEFMKRVSGKRNVSQSAFEAKN
jgi:hypothetical protein